MVQITVYPVLPIESLIPYIDASGDCWEWTGYIDPQGYGDFYLHIDGKGRNRKAHRLVWVALCGPVPGNLPLDHLCRRRHCVNPDHLEPVTHGVNAARGYGASAKYARMTHCARGHLFTPENKGSQHCLACRRMHRLRYIGGTPKRIYNANGSYKLTPENITDIRQYLLKGEQKTVLAKMFGVHRDTIRRIEKRVLRAYAD